MDVIETRKRTASHQVSSVIYQNITRLCLKKHFANVCSKKYEYSTTEIEITSPSSSSGEEDLPLNDPPSGDDDSWTKLQISPNSIGSMPYGDYRINIYEHSVNKEPGFNGTKRYFYAPIVLINHQSACSSFNNVTKEFEMRFRIVMWNEPVELEIVKYVNILTQQSVNRTQVI